MVKIEYANKLDVKEIKKSLEDLKSDTKMILRILDGTGNEPGLIRQVSENTNFIISSKARSKVYSFAVGSGWLVTLIILIWKVVI